jgi:hypothetical protein
LEKKISNTNDKFVCIVSDSVLKLDMFQKAIKRTEDMNFLSFSHAPTLSGND